MASKRARRWCVALVVVLASYTTYRLTLHLMVQAKLDEIRKRGYPVTLAELDKWYPEPPPGENAADIYLQAFRRYDPWSTNTVGVEVTEQEALSYGLVRRNNNKSTTNKWVLAKTKSSLLPLVGSAKLPDHGEPLPPQMKALIAEFLADNADSLALLHRADTIPYCQFPSELGKRPYARLIYLESLPKAARLLGLEAIWHAENNRPDLATKSMLSSLGCARSISGEPLVIPDLVRMACQSITWAALKRVLSKTMLSDRQIGSLIDASNQGNESIFLKRAIGACYECGVNIILDDPWKAVETNDKKFRIRFLTRWYTFQLMGLTDIDHLHHINLVENFMKIAELPLLTRLAAARAVFTKAETLPWYCVLTKPDAYDMESLVLRHDKSAVDQLNAQTALAIERFRLAKTALPNSLAELSPEFIESMPIDPFTGQPLRYKKLAKGYVVYSVGEDGKDDGGDEKKDITFTVER